MPYIFGDLEPSYFRCLLRREFTTDLLRYKGEYVEVIAHAITCRPGNSLWLYVNCLDPLGGAQWHVPIQALVGKPCPVPGDMTYVQPWDCIADRFSVHRFGFLDHGAVEVLPKRVKGQYITSVAFTGSGFAEDSAQNKTMHICRLENGHIGAFPSNRLLWHDPAYWSVMTEAPDFLSLHYEARAEGNQHLFGRQHAWSVPLQTDNVGQRAPVRLNGVHSNPKERADWLQDGNHA